MPNLNQILSLVVASLMSVAANALVQFPVMQPTPKVGDVAKYRSIDLWTNIETSTAERELVRITDDRLVQRVTTTAIPPPKTSATPSSEDRTYTRDWSPCRSLENSTKVVCEGTLKFPMQIGAKYEVTDQPWLTGKGQSSMTCKVKREEKLTLAAGTFDTLLIECDGYWTDLSANARTIGGYSQILWYAPAYGLVVRTQFISKDPGGSLKGRTQTDLVEFIPAK